MSCLEGARQVDFGRRHIGLCGVPSTAPDMKHWRMDESFSPQAIRLSAVAHRGDACRRLEKMALSHTGEILRRPTVGKPR